MTSNQKVYFQVILDRELDTRLRQHIATKYNGTRKGTLSRELEIMISNQLSQCECKQT